MAGMLSMGPGVLLFGRIVKAGSGSRLSVVVGTGCIAAVFLAAVLAVAWATLRLEAKN